MSKEEKLRELAGIAKQLNRKWENTREDRIAQQELHRRGKELKIELGLPTELEPEERDWDTDQEDAQDDSAWEDEDEGFDDLKRLGWIGD